MKTVYDLHRFWTSMSAIFGFIFHIGRMTEFRTPDIYIELTAFVFSFISQLLNIYLDSINLKGPIML